MTEPNELHPPPLDFPLYSICGRGERGTDRFFGEIRSTALLKVAGYFTVVGVGHIAELVCVRAACSAQRTVADHRSDNQM